MRFGKKKNAEHTPVSDPLRLDNFFPFELLNFAVGQIIGDDVGGLGVRVVDVELTTMQHHQPAQLISARLWRHKQAKPEAVNQKTFFYVSLERERDRQTDRQRDGVTCVSVDVDGHSPENVGTGAVLLLFSGGIESKLLVQLRNFGSHVAALQTRRRAGSENCSRHLSLVPAAHC